MPPAVPKLVQRFRARELQRLVDASGLKVPRRGGTAVFMQNINVEHVPMGTPLHNPFLPRPLPNRNPNASKDVEQKVKGKDRKLWAPPRYSLRRQAELVKAARASGTLHLLPPGPKLSVEELEAAKREVRRRAAAAKKTSAAVEKAIGQAKAAKVAAKTEGDAESTSVSAEVEETTTATRESSTTRTKRRWVLRSPSQLARRRNSAALGYPGVVFRWTGKVTKKTRSGLTIYAGRRRMFKGHKWERYLDKRRAQIAVRMRDMPQRIARFKNVSLSPPNSRCYSLNSRFGYAGIQEETCQAAQASSIA